MNKQKLAFPNLGDGEIWDGMELRDYFAIRCAAAILSNNAVDLVSAYANEVAIKAYAYADAMMEEREK